MSDRTPKSIKWNFVMNAILTMSGFIFPMISFPYISTVLGPEGTGPVRFATSVVAYFSMFAQLGIPTYGIRACAKVRDNRKDLSKTVHELLFINLITNIFVYIVFFACIFLVPKFQKNKSLFVIISITIILNTLGMEYLFKGLEEYSYITIRSIIFKIIGIISMFFLVKSQEDYIVYGAITIFASSASSLLNFAYSRKYIDYKWYGGYQLGRHIRPIFVFFAMSCAATVYLNLDGIMLGFMISEKEVGYYDAAVKIKTILVSVVTSLGTVLLPRASYYLEQNEINEFRRITAKALNFVIFLATPLMVYFVIFAREGILFLSDEKFIPSISAMQIIMPTLLFIGMTNIMGIQILVPLGREKIVLYSEIAGAVVDIIINLMLIPILKSSGAAFGTTVAEFVVFIVQLVFLCKLTSEVNIKEAYRNISYWRIILGVIVSATASIFVKLLDVAWITKNVRFQSFILLSVSAMIFFGVYIIFMIAVNDKLTKEIVGSLLNKLLIGRKQEYKKVDKKR